MQGLKNLLSMNVFKEFTRVAILTWGSTIEIGLMH